MKNYAAYLFIGFISILIFSVYIRGQKFRKIHDITTGIIIKTDNGGRGNWGPGITYQYNVNGRKITSRRLAGELKYSVKDIEQHYFPVIFQKTLWGYDDVILITPRDFDYYHYPFPDTLKWVLQYMK